jgi:hypothetical protein
MSRISTWLATGAVSFVTAWPLPALGQANDRESSAAAVAVLQDFTAGLSRVHARNPGVTLRVEGHPSLFAQREMRARTCP